MDLRKGKPLSLDEVQALLEKANGAALVQTQGLRATGGPLGTTISTPWDTKIPPGCIVCKVDGDGVNKWAVVEIAGSDVVPIEGDGTTTEGDDENPYEYIPLCHYPTKHWGLNLGITQSAAVRGRDVLVRVAGVSLVRLLGYAKNLPGGGATRGARLGSGYAIRPRFYWETQGGPFRILTMIGTPPHDMALVLFTHTRLDWQRMCSYYYNWGADGNFQVIVVGQAPEE